MKHLLKAGVFAGGIALLATPVLAAEGILIVEKTTRGGSVSTNQIQIEKTRMRVEAAGPNGEKQIIVFDSTAQVIRMIDMSKKTYTEMTKAEIEQIGGQVNAMMAQMQEQLKNMPPEQRAQIEAMMKGRGAPMGAPAAAKTEFKKTGTDTVGKWACDKYEGYQNGQKTVEVCAVDPKALGFALTDFEVTKQMMEFFKKLMPQAADQMFSLGSADAQGFSGVPVRRITGTGPQQTVSEMTEVSRQTFADALFAVPAGFKKQASPLGGRGR